jgi:UTP--glucose-1-phosphate uridylyltransferase
MVSSRKNQRMTSEGGLREAEERMRAGGQPEEAIRTFAAAYERLVAGEKGLVSSDELEPAGEIPSLDDLPAAAGDAFAGLAIVKLNGGLATTMGLERPKSLVEARDGRTFLDLIVGQILALRRRHGVALPLLLMDSDATRTETLAALERYPDLTAGLPPDFLQSMVPKLDAGELRPVSWPRDPALEWCPPGHGDVYGALRRSGLLAELLDRGFERAMISNSDNLGAVPDPRIAAYLAAERIPFLAEVVDGTEADRKGGHIARRQSDGRLVLRETAQTPPGEEESFRDFRRWRYYNTNTLWVDLRAVAAVLSERDGVLELPLIVNRKTVDPREPTSTPVIQLESAMGAAIETFPGAGIVRVPRRRFAPVKTTDDLLLLRSDVYAIGADDVVEAVGERRDDLPYVELERRYYGLLRDFEARFPAGPPSLRETERLVVRGDVTFEGDVTVRGAVEVEAAEPTLIAAGTILEGPLEGGAGAISSPSQ